MADEHKTEIGLLALIAIGVIVLMGIAYLVAVTKGQTFDPAAYLVILTGIVGAINQRWTQRSVDRMGAKLAESAPLNEQNPLPVRVDQPKGAPVPVSEEEQPPLPPPSPAAKGPKP